MTSKEKAKELVEWFWHLDEKSEIEYGFGFGKKCAIFMVNTIIDNNRSHHINNIWWQDALDEINAL